MRLQFIAIGTIVPTEQTLKPCYSSRVSTKYTEYMEGCLNHYNIACVSRYAYVRSFFTFQSDQREYSAQMLLILDQAQ